MYRVGFSLLGLIAAVIAVTLPFAAAPSDAAPTPAAAAKTAWAPVKFDYPVVFTIAMDPEAALNGRITVSLANRLARNGQASSVRPPSSGVAAPLNPGPVHHAWVVPGGAMTLDDLAAECALPGSNVVGAFVVLPTAISNSIDNGIVLARANSETFLNVIAAQCNPRTDGEAAPNPLSIVWTSTTEHGASVRTQVEFFPIAVLTSVYLALAPQRTTQQTTTITYPTTTPIPAAGERTSVQNLNSSIFNPQGTGALQSGVLNAFSGSGLGTTIGAAPSPERQNFHAVDDAMGYIVKQINAACKPENAASWRFCAW